MKVNHYLKGNINICHFVAKFVILPVIRILLSMFAPRRKERGDGRSPVKTQANPVSTSSSVDER